MHCPYCGSQNLTETFNFNEHQCDHCGCEFKHDNVYRIFNEGDYNTFCEKVLNETAVQCDSRIGQVLMHYVREFSQQGPENLDIVVGELIKVAEDIHSDLSIGYGSRFDFDTLMGCVSQFETLGNTLAEREDLEIDMTGWTRFVEQEKYLDELAESKKVAEGFGDEDGTNVDLDGDGEEDGEIKSGEDGDPIVDISKEGEEIEERAEEGDEEKYGRKSSSTPNKVKRGYEKQKSGHRDAPRKSHRKGKDSKHPWQEEIDPETAAEVGIDLKEPEELAPDLTKEAEVTESCEDEDMTGKDTHGKEDFNEPGEGLTDKEEEETRQDRTDPTTPAHACESIELETSVKTVLESFTIAEVAEELEVDSQLVIEAAALGKTVAELLEFDMTQKGTHGKPDFNQSKDELTPQPEEPARDARAKPSNGQPQLEDEEVSEEEDDVEEIEEAAKLVNDALSNMELKDL